MTSFGRRAERAIGERLTRHAGLLLLVGLALCAASLAGFQNLKLRNDYRAFFEAGNPILERTDWLAARMGDSRETAVVIYRPESGDVLDSLSMLQYRQAADGAKALPLVLKAKSWLDAEKVVTLGEASERRLAAVPFLEGADIYTEEGVATLRNDLRSALHVSGRYVARDETSAVILLQLDLEQGEGSRVQRLADLEAGVRKLEADLQRVAPGDRLILVGSTLFDYASTQILREDARRLFPVAVLLVSATLFFLYRSILFTVLGMLLILLPVIATAGLAAALGWEFSTLSISGLLLVGTLAVADILHVANTYFVLGHEFASRRDAVCHAFAQNFWAITATSSTTLVGEIALLFSASPPVRVMGQIVILGVIIAWLIAVLMLPWVLLQISPSPRTGARLLRSPLTGFVGRIARKPWPMLAVFAALLVICALGLTRSRVDDSMSGWFTPATQFRQGMDILDAGYLSLRTITLAYRATDADRDELFALADGSPAASPDLTKVQARLEAGPDGHWLSAVTAGQSIAARLSQSGPTGFRPDAAIVQADPPPLSTRALSDAGLITQFEPGKADYLVSYFDPKGRSTFETLAAADQLAEVAQRAASGREPQVQGTALAFADLSMRNFWSMVQGSVLVLAVMTIMLMAVFRSWGLGLLSLAPNITPVLAVYAALAAMGGSINMAAVSVFSVACGIVVDDTIHFILSYRRELEAGHDPVTAIEAAVAESGTGVIASTLVIGAGFLILGLSRFALTAEKATMVGAAIFVAFLFDIFVLPALLVVAARVGLPRVTYGEASR
ncbi:MAG: MMPL family transporter [Pseudomonadota bacterium]